MTFDLDGGGKVDLDGDDAMTGGSDDAANSPRYNAALFP